MRYSVKTSQGSEGRTHWNDFQSIKEVKKAMSEYTGYTSECWVWDNKLEKTIYRKWVLELKPEVDMINTIRRDLRTTTGESLVYSK